MKKVQFAPGADIAAELEEHTVDGDSPHLTARRMVSRYLEMCRETLPFFKPVEWRLIVAVLGAYEGTAAEWPGVVSRAVRLEGAYHGDDCRPFLARLESLSPAERMAVLDRIDRYWADCSRSKTGDAALPGEARIAL